MAAKRILPLLDRVLVEKITGPAKSAGGVLLPESAQAKGVEATVVAVGPGRYTASGSLVPMHVKEGDTVLLPEYGGQNIKIDGQELSLYREDELLAKLSN